MTWPSHSIWLTETNDFPSSHSTTLWSTYDGNATGFYESKSNSEAIKKGLEPRGTTRLYDTIIEQIDEQTARVDDFKKGLHPSILQLNPRIAVICAVLTDGEDNMSINRSRHVASKIEAHIKNYGHMSIRRSKSKCQRYRCWWISRNMPSNGCWSEHAAAALNVLRHRVWGSVASPTFYKRNENERILGSKLASQLWSIKWRWRWRWKPTTAHVD